ncbi:PREDICTED: uncharacterized protein LOC109155290 [Ipomoea nil]|uniref:uncharacterized protein LOC109155290 n=1 Tax=Ipomoea nil TaxID=35883 RepID=UPI000901CBEB|nr:PREDICTED: uncharacterized protein LOC109155290 [Ipomoea nil]
MAGRSVASSERAVSNVAISSVTSIVNSLATAHQFISIKLTYKKFLCWRSQVVPFLRGHELMGFIDGTNPCPPAFLSGKDDLYDDATQYRSLAGALQYLTVTRPDLSFAVNQVYQHMHALTVSHWEQLKRVLRYVKGTITYGLRIRKSVSRELHAFSDSDWASCPEDRKSTSGYTIFLGSNLVSWVCKK